MPLDAYPFERLSRMFGTRTARTSNRKSDRPANPWIVLAIGNPGKQYARSRHNVGWWAADALRRETDSKLRDEGPSRIAHVKIRQQATIIAYPKTYVNRSGVAARATIQHYKTETERLIVLTDDIHLAPGRIRVRRGGGAGGHNGLKSIIDTLQDQSFPRIRIGIGKPSGGDTQIDHVLGEPSDEDLAAIEDAVDRAAHAVKSIITNGVEIAMNEFNAS